MEIKPDAHPWFYKVRSVPYANKEAIEKDLDWLEKAGVLDKVKFSDWAAPTVPVPSLTERSGSTVITRSP